MSALRPESGRCSAPLACPLSANNGLASYSITSSARAMSIAGRSKPSAFAVLRLITSFVLCEASLTARQQFVAHPLRIHSRPPLAAVRECAHSLITYEPCYLRNRKAGVTEIVRGEIGAELIEDFTKTQAFRSQPPRQRPVAQAKHPRNSGKLRLAMRQEWSDRIFDSDT